MLWHRCKCGALIPQGVPMCEKCMEGESAGLTGMSRHMEYNLYRRDKKAAAFYVSKEWRKTRELVITSFDGLDPYAFVIQHRIETADMVHHIVELEDDWSQRINIQNLIPLSNTNHGIITAIYAKDEQSKKEMQNTLRTIVSEHWKGQGRSKLF